jgi:hypothetical protein
MNKKCHYCGADLTHYDADNDTIQPPATQQDETLLQECVKEIERCGFECEAGSLELSTAWQKIKELLNAK